MSFLMFFPPPKKLLFLCNLFLFECSFPHIFLLITFMISSSLLNQLHLLATNVSIFFFLLQFFLLLFWGFLLFSLSFYSSKCITYSQQLLVDLTAFTGNQFFKSFKFDVFLNVYSLSPPKKLLFLRNLFLFECSCPHIFLLITFIISSSWVN